MIKQKTNIRFSFSENILFLLLWFQKFTQTRSISWDEIRKSSSKRSWVKEELWLFFIKYFLKGYSWKQRQTDLLTDRIRFWLYFMQLNKFPILTRERSIQGQYRTINWLSWNLSIVNPDPWAFDSGRHPMLRNYLLNPQV